MNPVRVLLSIAIAAISASAHATILEWVVPEGDRLEITRTAGVQFLMNDSVKKNYEERNIVDLTCHGKKEGAAMVHGGISVYERGESSEVFHLREEHHSEFTIDLLGRFDIPKEYFMPNLRHLPTLPGKEVATGDAWSANAELILNNFSVPFKLTFPVEYRLAKMEKDDKGVTALIEYRFIIDMDLAGGSYPPDFPKKILGRDEGTIRWDVPNKRPLGMKERYRIVFVLQDEKGRIATSEFRMEIDTIMKMFGPVTVKEKDDAKETIGRNLPEGVEVDTEKRGLVFRLGDVLFDFDSAGLRDDSREKLDAIASVLREKYPDREIIVEGHTDNIGKSGYNRKLSMDRAESVARYLKPKTGSDKLSYRGFGADRPISGNDSGEGRQRNRRVEIIIKLQ